MPAELPQTETTVDGSRTRRWVLEAGQCPELASVRLARLGVDDCAAPYSRVRLRPSGSFFLASLEGEGQIFLEGRWQRIKAGALCMAPPRLLNAFHAVPGRRWRFAWVRYEEPREVQPLVGADSPLKLATGAADFARVIEGLRTEWDGPRDPRLVHHWISLLHGQATRLARPWQMNDRLWKLWDAVGRDLIAPWTLQSLAARVHLSAEHLRRLCWRELGRSPMQHVTYMRLQRAQHLLETTDDKLEAIAAQIGYQSALVFSRAFKRWIGMNPTDYRQRR